MKREIIRVEPISSNFENWNVPVATATRAGNMVFVSGMPPFDPDTGEIVPDAPIERQAELILNQMKLALETAGSDLEHVLKCNIYCISASHFQAFNEVYRRFFPEDAPARIFTCVPEWTGPFAVEIDCIAVTKDSAA
jgi:2-iminobutanoate/2-iminopropanoate deaminase